MITPAKPMHIELPPGVGARCACGSCPAPEAKPTRLMVGQRWSDNAGPYEITAASANGEEGRWRRDGDSRDEHCEARFVLCDTFLGYAKPAAPTAPPPERTCPQCEWAEADCSCAPPAPPRPIRREVSANGRDWCDYARLTDADAFEAYPWRREALFGNYMTLIAWPAPKPDPGRAETESDQAGAAAAALVSRPGT